MFCWISSSNICKIHCFSITHWYECIFIETSIIYTYTISKLPGFSICQITMNISLFNSRLLSWDGILDSKKSKEDVSKIIQPIYLQNMQSNPWFKQYETIFEHQMTIWTCVFLSLDVVMTSFINKTFQIMVLKICMLQMKYKIYRYYLICVSIHNFL